MTESPVDRNEGSPFHHGEQAVQDRLGVRDIDDWARKVVRDHLPEQHRSFYTALPFLVVAGRDTRGRPWVTLLDGPDGFVTSPDPRQLVIESKSSFGDALEHSFEAEADIGILGIELATRRRNRVNGRVVGNSSGAITMRVDQSFGNCPQYIREHAWRRVAERPTAKSVSGNQLTPAQQEWIETSDTFFIASGFRGEGESPTFGMDASHRGGERGFVRVLDEGSLQFPDYAGNNHYNTIGNLVLDPRAGFLFVDFETGSLLQLTGETSIDWDSDKISDFPGARRLVTLNIEEVVEIPSAVGLRWEADAESVRSLRLIKKVPESDDVTSFIFEARDGGPLAAFEPGQHLPIELSVPGTKEPARRTYSLSSSPSDGRYRITVKREPAGLVSGHLHDNVEPGSIIDSRRPAGDFMMTCNICPLVLVSAGVGITPMVSILHTVVSEGSDRPVWFVYGARDGNHHPLANEVRDLVEHHPNISLHVAYSRPGTGDEAGKHYDSEGRVTGALLAELVQNVDAHYFLCGPTRFMAEIQANLERQNVPNDQIHFETFGPVS
ncbi:MAG: pyridoxamine 5'-phosphate oxidase family protein [Alphaproteobacteria bacterium]|nr:pyridoxamine 5'-phosphate oxidase family protein [Alphaproteobacteria bacterium]